MKLDILDKEIREHSGELLCEQINNEKNKKVVRFRHVVTPPVASSQLPAIGRLQDFYDTVGSVVFYYDEVSDDAGKRIASPTEWAELHELFNGWIEGLDSDERAEIVPSWVDSCVVIGETPQSGNYILMATEGAEAGQVFEFDHDGFEFVHEANDVIEYVAKLLNPNQRTLTSLASHMRFVVGDPMTQWWIQEFKDNRGHVVTTREARQS